MPSASACCATLHDGVGGVLTHLLLDVRGNRLSAGEIEQELQAAVDDLRNMASAIDAGNEPIDEALAMFRERVAGRLARAGIVFDYRCSCRPRRPAWTRGGCSACTGCCRRGVANSLRHADPSRIELVAEAGGGGAIRILLSDDGGGFEPQGASGSPGEGRGAGQHAPPRRPDGRPARHRKHVRSGRAADPDDPGGCACGPEIADFGDLTAAYPRNAGLSRASSRQTMATGSFRRARSVGLWCAWECEVDE